MEPVCVLEGWASKKGQLERPPVAVSSSSSQQGIVLFRPTTREGPGAYPALRMEQTQWKVSPGPAGDPQTQAAQPSPSTPGGSLGPD